MLDYAREARAFVAGKERHALNADRALAYALTRCIEVIGEAATHISLHTSRTMPEIPWSLIASLESLLAGGPESEVE